MSDLSPWEGLLFAFAMTGGVIALALVTAFALALIDRWSDK